MKRDFCLFFNLGVIRWGLVACVTFLTDFVIFLLLVSATGGSYLGPNIISFIIATFLNFILHNKFTFSNKDNSKFKLFRYLVTIVLALSISSLVILVLIALYFPPSTSKIISSLFLMPINYLSMKYFVFR